jgi:hypothetical protein
MERMVGAHFLIASRWWIRVGQWRSYNVFDGFPTVRTTALGNLRIAEHKHFYNGFKNNSFVWRME